MLYSFPNFEPVICPISSSNGCFLTCIWVSQVISKVFWYFHVFNNFPHFVVIHIVKGFSVVNEAKVDVFLEFPFSMIQGNLFSFSENVLNATFIACGPYIVQYYSMISGSHLRVVSGLLDCSLGEITAQVNTRSSWRSGVRVACCHQSGLTG